MRGASLLVAAAIACSTMQLTPLADGSYARDDSGRKAVLATTEADYARLWATLIGDEEEKAPAVDFRGNVVVFLLAGTRNTGGWTVVPKSVTMEGRTAVIRADVQGPPPGGIATMSITSPWAVVQINSRDVDQVRWEK